MSEWKAASDPTGRVYYFRGQETTWEKPEGFVEEDPWRQVKDAEGQSYYYNTITNATAWHHPDHVNGTPAATQQDAAPEQTSAFVAGGSRARGGAGGDDFGAPDRRMERRDARHSDLPQKPSGGMPWEDRYDRGRNENAGFRGPMPIKLDEPEYGSHEANEEAFFKLLRKYNITPDMQWRNAMKLVFRERDFRALKDPAERADAFDKFCQEMRAQEKGKEMERQKKIADDFRKMLTTHEEIVHYTRWKTARPIIEREAVFKAANSDEIRRPLFEEYVAELRKQHEEKEAAELSIAKRELAGLLKELVIDPDTTWYAARDMIHSNERFVNEDIFRPLHGLHVIQTFTTHVQELEREANEKKQAERMGTFRRERHIRDNYKELLAEKRAEGKIRAGSKWTDFYPHIKDDERYIAIINNSGSSAMDFFWDVVEEEDRMLRTKKNHALDVLEEQRHEMDINTTLQDFTAVMATDKRTSDFDEHDLSTIYDRLMDKIKKREEDDKLNAERHQRKATDALRSTIKRIDPPVRLGDKYEDIAPKLAGVEEFEALDDAARRSAFEKHMRRLKEKDEDFERDRARRDRDRDRDRDRHARRRTPEDRDRDRRRHTRTPEDNAYEADRRKAQADRERSYRPASFGLSPPPRDSRRDDRDRDRDDRYRRRGDDRMESVYERERREREAERERSYINRADPRDVGIALHYGDEEDVGSRPGSVRKRQGSEGSGRNRELKVRLPIITPSSKPVLTYFSPASPPDPRVGCRGRRHAEGRRARAAERER